MIVLSAGMVCLLWELCSARGQPGLGLGSSRAGFSAELVVVETPSPLSAMIKNSTVEYINIYIVRLGYCSTQ